MTIFRRWGRVHWVLDTGSRSGPRYSPRHGYDTEEAAVATLWHEWAGVM